MVYVNAPNRSILPTFHKEESSDRNLPEVSEDILDAWTWANGDYANELVVGLEESVRYILGIMQDQGPFDGVVGFSVGASLALVLVSLTERAPDAELMASFGIDDENVGHSCFTMVKY